MVAGSRCSPLDKPRGEHAWRIVRARWQVRGAGFLSQHDSREQYRDSNCPSARKGWLTQ